MTQAATKPQSEVLSEPSPLVVPVRESPLEDSHEWQTKRLRVLWHSRRLFARVAALGLAASTLIALSIPKSYTSTTQLMPPDSQSASGMAMMAALASKAGAGAGGIAGDLLGLKTSGALFVGVLRSQTSQNRLVQQFDLQNAYGKRLIVDARIQLDENTAIAEDRKSGIITISVRDSSPRRAAALAAAYVDQLNSLVSELSTSAAHRERVFLDERLKVVKQDLDSASEQLAEFSSKSNTLDVKEEGRAMLEAAANLAGQLIAAQSQLEALRQIYTDRNPRVLSLNARVVELRRELQKLSGTDRQGEKSGAGVVGRSADMPYPSIQNLPLLGMKYADYYRREKIQETVYELLTEQDELAKVQEAKETPSVKVLDAPMIPEKKSFPPRLWIMFLGTLTLLASSMVWVLGSAYWGELDPQDPRKLLAQEVATSLRAHAPWAQANGNRGHWKTHGVWSRLTIDRPSKDGSAEL